MHHRLRSDDSDETEQPSDQLHLQRCPECEYNLAGLPRRHRCPECGYEYDECTFVLDFRKDRKPRSRSRWFSYIGVVLLLALFVMALVLRAPGRLRPALLAVAVGIGAIPVIAIALRPPRIQPVEPHWRVRFEADGLSMGADSLAAVGMIMAFEDHQGTGCPGPPRLRASSGTAILTWSNFRRAELERGEGDWHRLSLRYANSREAKLCLGWFECTPDQAAWLDQELNRRILAMRP